MARLQQIYYNGVLGNISIKLSFIHDNDNNNANSSEFFVIMFDDKKFVCKVMESNNNIKKNWKGAEYSPLKSTLSTPPIIHHAEIKFDVNDKKLTIPFIYELLRNLSITNFQDSEIYLDDTIYDIVLTPSNFNNDNRLADNFNTDKKILDNCEVRKFYKITSSETDIISKGGKRKYKKSKKSRKSRKYKKTKKHHKRKSRNKRR